MAITAFHAPRIDAALRFRSAATPDLTPSPDMRAQALIALLRSFAPTSDGRRSLWIGASRGTLDEFAAAVHGDETALPLAFPRDVHDDAGLASMFHVLYPDDERWYRIDATLSPSETIIHIDDGFSIRLSPGNDGVPGDADTDMLLDWLLAGVEECVRRCTQGTYDALIRERLPYDMRFGTMSRCDYLHLAPDADAYVHRLVARSEARRFAALADAGGFRSGSTAVPFDAMTLRRYAGICRIGYEALGLPAPIADGNAAGGATGISAGDADTDALAWLERYGDPRGRAPRGVDVDSPATFAALADDRCGDVRTWNVRPGPGFEWMALMPVREDGGWSFVVDSAAYPMCAETVPFALALLDAGVPVEVDDASRVAAAVLGTDLIGVVPRYVMPSRRERARFFGPEVGDVVQMPAEGRERFAGMVDWLDPEPVRLLPVP